MSTESYDQLWQVYASKCAHCDDCKRVSVAKASRDPELSYRRFLRWLRITHGIEFKEAGARAANESFALDVRLRESPPLAGASDGLFSFIELMDPSQLGCSPKPMHQYVSVVTT